MEDAEGGGTLIIMTREGISFGALVFLCILKRWGMEKYLYFKEEGNQTK